ncbi:hypothetical protein [Lewinella sp. W8]|uniref:hypothetical protein n=1 Tax=Lewinella sp. W8 TaxID=2528208 RepID=UPI0010679BCC|nr:hypothetical protein [Lewinella sp. W8]MTB49331.1 hypothetical protein [Lewinella sp. W8]
MWKNLKSLFIVEEPEKGKKNTTQSPKTAPAGNTAKTPAKAPASDSTPPTATTGPVTGAINDRFVKVLMEAMETANLPGFDYLEYKKALQNLKKMNFTDGVRFQTAYAAAQGMGVTPQQLTDSAQHYLNILKKEEQKFQKALQGQKSQQIKDKEAQLTQLDQQIAGQEAKIKELKAQIEKTRKEQQKLQQTISKSTQKLATTQADFETTYSTITAGITKDIELMKEYLK